MKKYLLFSKRSEKQALLFSKRSEKQALLFSKRSEKQALLIPILLLSSFILSGCAKKQTLPSGKEGESKEQPQQQESFTGKIKDAILKEIPLKCDWSGTDFSSVGYIKNKKFYGETVVKEKKSYVIIADNCLWSWEENKNEGINMCLEKSEDKDIWSSDNAPKDDYHCVPAVFSDSVFSPPAKVNFLDVNEMMRKSGVTIPKND